MAGKSTISITFKLDGDAKGFKDLARDAEGLRSVIANTVSEAQNLKGNVINFAALATGIDAAQRSLSALQKGMKDLADASAVQEVAETKLSTVMRQRMGASDAEIESIKSLTRAQQELGVIGDEVQMSGAQQMATFLSEKDSLEALIPAMNNLIAQQSGLEATTQDAVSVGNLMGKVMQGQTSALTRVGITFTEAEEKVLKYGTESERAAMLAKVITNNVGDMNAQLAQTDSGKQQQLANKLGDVKEEIGGLVNGALPFVTIAAQAGQAVASVSTLISGFKALTTTLYSSAKAFAVSTAAFIKNKVSALANAAAQKAASAATAIFTGVQKALNLVLSLNPIGIIITALGALVAAVVAAYRNCDDFRDVCDKLWSAIKPLAQAVMNSLGKALSWVADKAKAVWGWLKKILHLDGQKADVEVDVKTSGSSSVDTSALEAKYANYGSNSKTQKASPEFNDSASTLKEIGDNISILQGKLQKASLEEAAIINQQIAAWTAKKEAIENAGKAVEDNGPIWREDASNISEIDDNLDILQDRLKTASIEEAALINQQISLWSDKKKAIQDAGKSVEDNSAVWREEASTLAEIGDNIEILTSRLQTATVEEAALINQQIDAWNAKADAIRNAGREADSVGRKVEKSFTGGWGAAKSIGNSIKDMTESLKGNGDAWSKVTSVMDGFINIYDGIKTIVGIIQLLTQASAAHAATKGVEAAAETTEAGVRAGTAASGAAASAGVIAANKLEAASFQELAAAEYMAAHAAIPFAGFAIAAGFTAAMRAVVAAAGIPALAEGGVASGPTLALVGEYAGASGNPEVIAPLDKLRSMLSDTGQGIGGRVEFRIDGRTLVGVLAKENNLTRRS